MKERQVPARGETIDPESRHWTSGEHVFFLCLPPINPFSLLVNPGSSTSIFLWKNGENKVTLVATSGDGIAGGMHHQKGTSPPSLLHTHFMSSSIYMNMGVSMSLNIEISSRMDTCQFSPTEFTPKLLLKVLGQTLYKQIGYKCKSTVLFYFHRDQPASEGSQ
jgi:hypothetical protein